MAAEASHRLCRDPPRQAREPGRCCFVGRPHTHALRSAVQGCHRSAAHEYLLRRRIERAQEMLVGTGLSLVDIALSVGFQTQSHFTNVFKRYAGQPPRAWRESRDVPRA